MRFLVLTAMIFTGATTAFANCYVLKNDTANTQRFTFKFNRMFPGALPSITLGPHSQYPKKGSWCWTRPAEYYAIAAPEPGAYTPSWRGPLVLGNRGKASPSGTYVLRPLPHEEIIAHAGARLGPAAPRPDDQGVSREGDGS